MRKQVLSLLLVLAMCLGLLSGAAQAAGGSVTSASGEMAASVPVNQGVLIQRSPTWVYAAADPLKVEVTDLGTFTVTMVVSYPDGYSYQEEHSFSAKRYTTLIDHTVGIEVPPGDSNDVTSWVTTQPVDNPGGGSNTYWITLDKPQANLGVIPVVVGAGAGVDVVSVDDFYPAFTPLDPTERLDHDFSRWPFTGWLCDGKPVSGEITVDRDMTLVAQWGEDLKPEAPDKTREVWFYANGGTMTAPDGVNIPYYEDTVGGEKLLHTLTYSDGTVYAFPTAVREGYTFDGWYTAKTGGTQVFEQTDLTPHQGGGGSEWSSDQIVLWAHWTQKETTKTFRINFFPNGGLLTDVGGYPHDLLVKGEWDDPKVQEAYDAGIGIDRYSEIGWMNTGENGTLSALPGAAREGYTFDGWYIPPTGTDLWSKLGEDYLQEIVTDFSGMTKVTASTVFSGEANLVAKWTRNTGSCIVAYDWNGASFLAPIEPQTVAKGGRAPLYSISADFGRTLKGWATEDGVLWNSTMKVTEDMTLYAVWDPEFEDDFNFSNSDAYFDGYQVSKPYLRYLLRNENAYTKAYVRDFAASAWGGSCFGMSAVYAMQKAGALNVSVFQKGARGLRDLEYPIQSNNVRDLVNFYMLSQLTGASSAAKDQYYSVKDLSTRYQNILKGIAGSGGPALLGFNYVGGGHAVIAKSVSGGRIAIWDPNFPGVDLTLTVTGGKAVFSGPSGLAEVLGVYNTNTELKYVMPLNTRSQSYDSNPLQSVFGSKADQSAAASSPAGRTILTSTADSFTVAAADGRTAVVKNGEPSGDLPLTRTYIDGSGDNVYRYSLDVADAGALTFTLNGADAVVQVVSGSVYAQVKAAKLNTVTVSSEAVATSAAASGQQSITMVSEQLDGDWNKVTVTGSDTGFRLGAAKGQLTLSSDNSVSATVVGENSDTWEKGKSQSVSVTPGGVTLTVAQLSGGAVREPVPFPFTDVPESQWYHPYVKAAYEAGLVEGYTKTTYQPNATLTLAQAVTLAARIYAENHGETAPSGTGALWYQPAYDYCVAKGVIDGSVFPLSGLPRTATRFEMAAILDGAIPAERMDNSVSVTAIPDLKESDPYGEIVYRWYRAGLVAGDRDGSFSGTRDIKRSEVAKILCTINRLV